MTKRITFIGPHFTENVSNVGTLKINFLEKLWAICKQLNSDKSIKYFVKQVKLIEKEENTLYKNEQLSILVKKIIEAFYSPSFQDVNKRLLTFKHIVCQSMQLDTVYIEEENRKLLGDFFKDNEYLYSYTFDMFVENLIQPEHELRVCIDRQMFLKSESTKGVPILYKLYGSFNQIETVALTNEEKKQRILNLRLAISKVTQLENISIYLIGFDEDDDELEVLLKELALRNKTNKISLVKFVNDNEKIKNKMCIDSRTGIAINVITASIKNYVYGQGGLENKPNNSFPILVADKASVDQIKNQEESPEEQEISSRTRRNIKKNKIVKIPYKTIVIISCLSVFFVWINVFFSFATIKGESMVPNFSSSDYIVLNKQYSKVNRFDVIAFKSPDEQGQEYIKRVIGLPGDVIEYIEDKLYIDGNVVEESYLNREKKKLGDGEIFTKDFSLKDLAGVNEVPKNKLFVLGDNRLYSRDSRNFGFIDVKDIKGDVKLKIWPIKESDDI